MQTVTYQISPQGSEAGTVEAISECWNLRELAESASQRHLSALVQILEGVREAAPLLGLDELFWPGLREVVLVAQRTGFRQSVQLLAQVGGTWGTHKPGDAIMSDFL